MFPDDWGGGGRGGALSLYKIRTCTSIIRSKLAHDVTNLRIFFSVSEAGCSS
jgi:hypothetical protein